MELRMRPDAQGKVSVVCPRCKRNVEISAIVLDGAINRREKIACSCCTNHFLFTKECLTKQDKAHYDQIEADWKARNLNRMMGTRLNIEIRI